MSAVGDGSSLAADETSMGSNESVSSQSSSASASEMPAEKSDHVPLSTSLSSGSNSRSVVLSAQVPHQHATAPLKMQEFDSEESGPVN